MPRLFQIVLLSLTAAGGAVLAARAQPAPPAAAADGAPTPDWLRLPEEMLPGLQPLLNAALDAAPQVLQGRLAVLSAEAGEEDARSGLYPHISAGAGVDGRQEVRKDIPGIHYSLESSYGLAVTQPLWHWHALADQARIGQIQRELAENDLAEARRTLVLELRAQYTDLILLGLEYRQTQENARRAERKLAADEERATHGELAATALADERLAGEENQVQLERQAAAAQRAREDFAVLLGRKDFTVDDLPGEIPPVPSGWAARLQPEPGPTAALAAGPVLPAALARADRERETARLGYEIQSVRLWPTLDAVAGVTQDQVSYTANIGSKIGVQVDYIGLRFNWNIFDGWSSQAGVSRARADLRQKNLAFDLAAQALQRRLADGWLDLRLAQRELALAETRLQNATDRLASARVRHEAGQLADDVWQQQGADLGLQHLAVLRLRAAQLLRVAEYALLLERATLPESRLTFP